MTRGLQKNRSGTMRELAERVPGSAPQSPDEIQRWERELQAIDPRLHLRWNAEAIVVKGGSYDVLGRAVPPTYDGRWEVILLDDAGFKTADWRPWTLVTRVSEVVEQRVGRHTVRTMHVNGPYAPVGEWLVAYLREIDRANVEAARRLGETLEAMHARQDADAVQATDGEVEALERVYHGGTKEGGGVSEFHPVGITLATTTQE